MLRSTYKFINSLLFLLFLCSGLQAQQHRTNDGLDEKLQVNMFFFDTTNTVVLADAAQVRYNNLYSAAVTSEDAGKPTNVDENIAVERDNYLLMVERRPLIDFYDTVPLNIYNLKLRSYRLDIFSGHFIAPLFGAFLHDSYLNTETPVSLDSTVTTAYHFTVTDAASATPYRFKILYRPLIAMPVTFTKINAFFTTAGIAVQWNVDAEENIHHYEVEKSRNGKSFAKATDVTARHNSLTQYDWLDAMPAKGNNFYRIKAVGASGKIVYSNVVNVNHADEMGSIITYPNPVKNKVLSVQFINKKKGGYTLLLFDSRAQQVFSQIIQHNGGSAVYSVLLSAAHSKGVYQLRIVSGTDDTTGSKIVIE